MAELQLEVVTPERVVLSERVESVVAPGIEGYFGVWPNHAPLVAGLRVGKLAFGPVHGPKRILALSGGFLQVVDNKVTILADAAELPEEIDVARARRAKERAERRLQERQANIDYARARAALERALNRLEVAGVGLGEG